MPYNKFNPISIENFGKKLEGNSLRDLNIDSISKKKDKGGFNKIVEADYFKIPNNNEQAPDFSEVGIELKVTPLKEVKKKNTKKKC